MAIPPKSNQLALPVLAPSLEVEIPEHTHDVRLLTRSPAKTRRDCGLQPISGAPAGTKGPWRRASGTRLPRLVYGLKNSLALCFRLPLFRLPVGSVRSGHICDSEHGARRAGPEQGAVRRMCLNGHVDAMRQLLDEGAEVNRANNGTTPLLMACMNGHADAARLLLDSGAEVDQATPDGAALLSTPARMATSTLCGCCWTTARRSIGDEDRSDTTVHRLPPGPRPRGAAGAGQRR